MTKKLPHMFSGAAQHIAVFHAASGKKYYVLTIKCMWRIFKCTFTYMHSWAKTCKGDCASWIKNNIRHYGRSCYVSKAEWGSTAEKKVTPSAGFKCTNYSSRLLQWSAALLLLTMAVLGTQASVGQDQNKCSKKVRFLHICQSKTQKPKSNWIW